MDTGFDHENCSVYSFTPSDCVHMMQVNVENKVKM